MKIQLNYFLNLGKKLNNLKQKTMYKVFFNHETKAHTIAKSQTDENDVEMYKGQLENCKSYMKPLNIIYQTIL